MKKAFSFLSALLLIFSLCTGVAATGADQGGIPTSQMQIAMIVLIAILGALFIGSIIFTVFAVRNKRNSLPIKIALVSMYVAALIVLVFTVLCAYRFRIGNDILLNNGTIFTPSSSSGDTTGTIETSTTETTEEYIPDPTYTPEKTETSDPQNWQVNWQIIAGDKLVDTYERPDPIVFGDASTYSTLQGVTTFRGDNYRSGATYGTAVVTDETLSELWKNSIGSLGWTGCGWTGQPIIVRWDDETKQIMNLYDNKKSQEDLVEVIYATLDGYIYFYDLKDGSATRDKVWVGMNFKGAGTLDPRGYPLMYVGSGDTLNGKNPRMYIISLIDGSILYEQSGVDEYLKRWWYAFDSAPLVDGKTDTLIWPGENGILYTIKLNTNYDRQAGTISVSPEAIARARYTANTGRNLGFESSAVIVGQYAYVADNGGMFFCVDLNTMELVWAQNVKDDVNATPIFEWDEDGNGYIYTATSMEYGRGTSYIHKLDAATGEILWEKSYSGIIYNKDVSGGILSTGLLGKAGTDLEGLIIYPVGKTPTASGGILVALNTKTGEVVWEKEMRNYTWSSPVALYTDSGKGYIFLCDSVGTGTLFDGKTGEVLDTISLGSNIEASPAVFENTIVVGTRGQRIYAITVN